MGLYRVEYVRIESRAKEELFYKVIEAESSDRPVLIGYQTDPDFTKGINFVFYMRTEKSSEEIERMHKDDAPAYRDLM